MVAMKTNWVVNIVGVLAILIAVVYVVRDFFYVETVPPCHVTYPPATSLLLTTSDGRPMSDIELQAFAGQKEWGVVDGLSVQKMEGAPGDAVLRFELKKGSATTSTEPKGGVGFPWSPNAMTETTAVCLAYDVWVPNDFEFGGGGILPGVASTETFLDDGADTAVRRLRSVVGWTGHGHLKLSLLADAGGGEINTVKRKSKTPLSKGAWNRIEQEVDLGDVGRSNGRLRLWIDGKLIVDRSNLALREKDTPPFSDLMMHVSFGGFGHSTLGAPKDSVVVLTPPEISWK
jgi:Polysaccharide lyase 14